MKKVLIITYYWPPAGGPGVQRVLKFAKYLPEFGWQPVILTVDKGEYPAYDESLRKDIPDSCKVYKTPALEPFLLYKKFTGMAEDEKIPTAALTEKKTNWKKKVAHWIRLNLFVPDAKIGWIPFAVKAGKHIIQKENPDIIFSSSPPPTVHLIAKSLARWSRIKWVADFRDPWTEIHYYEKSMRSILAKKIDSKLELSILRNSDKISCISLMDIEKDFGKKVSKTKSVNIPNGFDEDDFPANYKNYDNSSDKFQLMHFGSINKERLPENLFKSIKLLKEKSIINKKNFELTLIGKIEECIIDKIKYYGLSKLVNLIPYLPHFQAIKKSQKASVLLLLITQSEKNIRILPGKTFEYLRMQKPIFVLGPEDGEVARIINETKAGKIVDYHNVNKIHNYLKLFFDNWKNKKSKFFVNKKFINNYSRKKLTQELSNVFNIC